MADRFDLRLPDSFHGEFERIKARFLAKGHILAIKDCRPAFFKLPLQERLAACGLQEAIALDYLSDPAACAVPAGATRAGCMIPVAADGARSSVILILNQFPRHFDSKWVMLFRICVLYHELGRAEDLRCGACFDHSTQECRQKEADEYAAKFARRYLDDILCERTIEGKFEILTLWDWYAEVNYLGTFVP